ncbi:hypothetical protein [Nocardia testacea]|uniref:hypothetical protein n=1 Tax=Nocardia testacea TaxID=248551 RepID=UPI0005842CD0|nr:hypothetical protein [Nocardia testacea]
MTVSRWTSTEVRALRVAALRETQEEFAERAGYMLPTIKKWHRATWDKPVRGRSAEALDTMLRELDDEQRARFDTETAAVGDATPHDAEVVGRSSTVLGTYAWEVDSDVRRREFGKLATAVTASAIGWQFGEHLGHSDAQRLLAAVGELEEKDRQVGGGALVRFALDQLEHAKHTLDTASYDTATGHAFASATGHLAVLTGWLAHDSDRHMVARRCYAEALSLASEAGDEDLIVHTCLNAANQSIDLARRGQGSPHYALKLIDRARTLAGGRPPGGIHALIAGREAQARGLLGDRVGFGRAVSTAWREIEHAISYESLEECPTWLWFVTPAEIRGHEARGYGEIGEVRKSIELLYAASAEERGARNAVSDRAHTAVAHLRMGDIQSALSLGTAALTELENVTSGRTLRVLAPIRTVDHPAAEDFRDRFASLENATRKESA